jgi:exosortase D (VPLPA-CTERM-specific)
MNSFRIGVIGILVQYGGPEMAEGFLHDFEGWVVFMACAAILFLEMAILTRIGPDRLPLRDAFRIDFPQAPAGGEAASARAIPIAFFAGMLLLPVAGTAGYLVPDRQEIVPDREVFALFPMTIGGWHGTRDRMEKQFVDVLKFDDYLLGDYSTSALTPVNLYVAYYASQRKGESVHSPRTCIPGGGWKIRDLSIYEVDGVSIDDQPLLVNRTLIQLGDARQLVYYWFQQRGRVLTNEYLVKWYLLWDALTKNRTDGALVRLTTPIPVGADPAEADAALSAFAQAVAEPLERFIPN